MTQGAYRILRADGDLIESFVAAPGPGGWRWFGRVHRAGSQEELYVVDHVVDAEWRLVRFRLLHRDAGEIRVEPASDGLTVIAADQTRTVPGGEVVWSPSPASLVVLDRYFQAAGTSRASGVEVAATGAWRPVTVALEDRGSLRVNGQRLPVAWAAEEPARVEGWFERLGTGEP